MYKVYKPKDLVAEAQQDIARFNELILSKPAPGSAGLTGTWRVMKPVIDSSKCIKCGLCWLHCPDNVIEWKSNSIPEIDYAYCKGCGVCASVCPVKAIRMVVEGE